MTGGLKTFLIFLFIWIVIGCIIQVLKFYGISLDAISIYLTFYVFILLTFYFLPSNIEGL
jgi:hypothetical protein